MDVEVVGPLDDPEKAAFAANRLAAGAAVVVWAEDPEGLRAAVEQLPPTPPGRLCTWAGSRDDEVLAAFIKEVLDPPVK